MDFHRTSKRILEVKQAVRERDGCRCTRCGMTNEEHKGRYHGKSLHVHRLAPGSRYTIEGCVTICQGCHGKEPKLPAGTRAELTGVSTVFARVPKWLWKALSAEAEQEDRSATAQLIRILKERYAVQEPAKRPGRPRKEQA